MNDRLATVRNYYLRGLWSAQRVQNAVGRWLMQAEADALLSEAPAGDTPEADAQTGATGEV